MGPAASLPPSPRWDPTPSPSAAPSPLLAPQSSRRCRSPWWPLTPPSSHWASLLSPPHGRLHPPLAAASRSPGVSPSPLRGSGRNPLPPRFHFEKSRRCSLRQRLTSSRSGVWGKRLRCGLFMICQARAIATRMRIKVSVPAVLVQ